MKITSMFKQPDWENYYSKDRKIRILPKYGLFTSYDIYLCDKLIQKYIPRFEKKKARICEIGSGDGKLLKKFSLMLGCKPYGVDYSEEAASQAAKNGIKTLTLDVFDKAFSKKYKDYFDVVFSYGFVEHILPPEKAIKIHYDILKPGGYVIIQIPRFKGINFFKLKLLRPDFIPLHNLSIMNGNVLRLVCEAANIEKLFCKNYGTFKFRLPMEKKNIRFYLLRMICFLEYITNPLFRILFGDRGFETYFFSPAVMFIGRKKNK